MNILLIEDETRVADFIRRGLVAEGWSVTHVRDGESGITLATEDAFDAIVLDLMLPGVSGQDVCRKLRMRRNTTPILMLSALDTADERVFGLRLGADDYLAKPFNFDELVARLAALHRRATEWTQEGVIIERGGIALDRLSFVVRVEGQTIDLSHKEREILRLLLLGQGRVFSRERILNAVWGLDKDPLTNVVDVYVGRLRRKLGPQGARLVTVRNVGYRLD